MTQGNYYTNTRKKKRVLILYVIESRESQMPHITQIICKDINLNFLCFQIKCYFQYVMYIF
jgi:hypothetical protein